MTPRRITVSMQSTDDYVRPLEQKLDTYWTMFFAHQDEIDTMSQRLIVVDESIESSEKLLAETKERMERAEKEGIPARYKGAIRSLEAHINRLCLERSSLRYKIRKKTNSRKAIGEKAMRLDGKMIRLKDYSFDPLVMPILMQGGLEQQLEEVH